MVTAEASVWLPQAGARARYSQRSPTEFLPWFRSDRFETHVLINDLVHSLGRQAGPVSRFWSTYLEDAQHKPTVVDQYAADGTLIARFSKTVVTDEIWRLSFERTGKPELEHGLLVLSGRRTLCHFQIVGDRTFATCHARRLLLDQPPAVRRRWVPFPQQPGVVLSLLLMNLGDGLNRVTLSRVAKNGMKDLRWKGQTMDIPRLGCRLLCLNDLLPGGKSARPMGSEPASAGSGQAGAIARGAGGCEDGQARKQEYFYVESTHPYDFYTLIENGGIGDRTFSIQHVK